VAWPAYKDPGHRCYRQASEPQKQHQTLLSFRCMGCDSSFACADMCTTKSAGRFVFVFGNSHHTHTRWQRCVAAEEKALLFVVYYKSHWPRALLFSTDVFVPASLLLTNATPVVVPDDAHSLDLKHAPQRSKHALQQSKHCRHHCAHMLDCFSDRCTYVLILCALRLLSVIIR